MLAPLEQGLWPLLALMGKSVIVLAAAMVAAECCRGSAALRHAVRSAGMLAALLLPFVALVVPNWEWRVLPATPQTRPTSASRESSAAEQQPLSSTGTESDAQTKLSAKGSEAAIAALPTESEVQGSSSLASRSSAWNWQELLLLAWLAGVGLLVIRLCIGIFYVHRLLGRAQPVRNGVWLRDLAIFAAELKIRRPVTLLESSEIHIPMTYGFFYPRLLMPSTARTWEVARRNAVIYHELAHIVRLDSLTQLLAAAAEAIYWPNPLVWLHSSRMRIERERACDDFVLRHGARPSEYANELLEIASGNEISAALALPMARRSQLKTRLLALLDPTTRRESVSKSSLALVGGVTLAILTSLAAIQISAASAQTSGAEQAVAPAPPSQPSTPAAPAENPAKPQPPRAPTVPAPSFSAAGAGTCFASKTVQQRSSIHEDDDGASKWDLTWSGDTCSVKVHALGKLSFAIDGSSIESIASGGFFEATEQAGGHTRYIKVTPGDGQLQYSYSVDGDRRDFDDSARTWFSKIILGLERVSGVNARKRASQLLQQGGAEAVLQEVRNISSDHVAGIYLRTMLESTRLTPDMLRRLLEESAPKIESDYELGRLLTDVAARYTLDDQATRTDFLKASSSLASDYERARVLMQLLGRPNLSAAIVDMTLNSALKLNSDYEKGRVLTALASQKVFGEPLHATYLQAASAINSDYERARTLIALIRGARLSTDSVTKLLNAAAGISSDYEKARVLTAIAGDYKMTGTLRATYIRVASGISSQTERDRALKALGRTTAML